MKYNIGISLFFLLGSLALGNTQDDRSWVMGIPSPDPIEYLRPDLIADPTQDVNLLIRENAWSGKLLVIGISGKHTESIRLCKKYGSHTQDYGDLVIQIVGMDDKAEIRGIHIYDDVGNVKSAEFHNLKISTSQGARSPIMDIGRPDRLVFNNITLLPDPDNLTDFGGAGMKWGFDLGDGSDYLHINNCRRGKGQRFEEHWAYLKSTGELYITNNDIGGGNRTGFQVRTPGEKEPPHGHMVIANNYARDFGWDWGFNNGGACITIWESLDWPVYIVNNTITNAKYGCLAIAHTAPQEVEPHLLPSGRAHSRVTLIGNTFTNPEGDRSCVSINSTEILNVVSGKFNGGVRPDIIIDSKTAWKWGAPMTMRSFISSTLLGLDIQHWDGDKYVQWEAGR
jgi:hypothetical protein